MNKTAYFTTADKLGEIMQTYEGSKLTEGVLQLAQEHLHRSISRTMLAMAKNITVNQVFSMAGDRLPAGLCTTINAFLQQIRKPNVPLTAEERAAEEREKLPTDAARYSVYDRIETICTSPAAQTLLVQLVNPIAEDLSIPHIEKHLSMLYGFTPHQLLTAGKAFLPDDAESILQMQLQQLAK